MLQYILSWMESDMMDSLVNSIVLRLKRGNNIVIASQEIYFFMLGQLVTYIFQQLGGTHKYKSEYNYLTNPYLPKSIYYLGKRNLRFIKHLPQLLSGTNNYVLEVQTQLIAKQSQFLVANLDETLCSDAFYEGLYGNNLLLDLEG